MNESIFEKNLNLFQQKVVSHSFLTNPPLSNFWALLKSHEISQISQIIIIITKSPKNINYLAIYETIETVTTISTMDNKHRSQNKLSYPCSAHVGSEAIYISIDQAEKSVFKCMSCVIDNDLSQRTLIPLEQIMSTNKDIVFTNFPLSDRSLSLQIKEIISNPPTGEVAMQEIRTFFKDLSANILFKLEELEDTMLRKAEDISNFNKVLLDLYDSMSFKTELKQIVSDPEKQLDTKTDKIKSICATAQLKEEANAKQIKTALEKLKAIQKSIDIKKCYLIKNSVLLQLDAIDFLRVKGFKQSFNSTTMQSGSQSQNLSNLMKLVRNKFNSLTTDESAILEEELSQLEFLFQNLTVPNPPIFYDSIQELSEQETQIITHLIQEITRVKGEVKVKHEQKNPKYMSQSAFEDGTQIVNPEEIMKLVQNPANFCSSQYFDDLSQVMGKMKGVFGLFRVRKPKIMQEQRSAFTNLRSGQLQQLSRLAAQINNLTQQQADKYLFSKNPILNVQPNSNYIRRKIKIFTSLSLKKNISIDEEIDQLLVDFPIFELLPNLKQFIPVKMNFTQTNYKDSREIVINTIEKEVVLDIPKNRNGQVVSDTLDNKKGYLLKLSFNHHYGSHGTYGYGFFIGLIPDQNMHNQQILEGVDQQGFRSYPNHGTNINTRGSRLSSEEVRKVTNQLEFRWCISKKQFYISDPTYKNINQGDLSKFNTTQIYRFGINSHNLNDLNWKVSITEFIEIDPEDVDKF